MSFKILVAEDEEITLNNIVDTLREEGYDAVAAKDGREALEKAGSGYFDVLITDIKMPYMSGLDLLGKVKEKNPGVEVIIITGFGSIGSAVEAMKKGAYDYITKPFDLDELTLRVAKIHERKTLKKENIALKTYLGMNREVRIIAKSERMQKILSVIDGMKESDCSVLLTGESGVGKSLLAKIIHSTSKRKDRPFLSINCATLTEELLSSELFGQNVMEINIPPLRERIEDIKPLSAFFLQKHLPKAGKKITGISEEAMDILLKYSFPGNVRELENIIERAIILEKTPMINPESIPQSIRLLKIETLDPDKLKTADELIKDYAEKVLKMSGGNRTRAAEVLGISRTSLWKILKEE